MKIGEAAKKYGLSTDTLRYYIKAGLLIPKDTGRYSRTEFKARDIEDLELILHMKEQRFSLEEVLTALSLKRTSNMIEPETIRAYIELYEKKRHELTKQVDELTCAKESVERDIVRLSNSELKPVVSTGVPLRALALLRCPDCGGKLRLENADLNERYAYRGTLRCRCGKELQIVNGILETGNIYTGEHDSPDLKRELYVFAGGKFVSYLEKCLDKLCQFMERWKSASPVIMETHINGLFFAYNHLESVPEDSLYIVTDKYPELLREYKRYLESMGVQRDFLFIADDSMRFPLREKCVNLLVSCMSDNEYCLYNTGSYIGDMKRFLADGAEIIGTLLLFDDNAESQRKIHEKYPEGNPIPFSRGGLMRRYRDAGYQLALEEEGVVTKTNNNGKFTLACHVPGEALGIYFFRATPQR